MSNVAEAVDGGFKTCLLHIVVTVSPVPAGFGTVCTCKALLFVLHVGVLVQMASMSRAPFSCFAHRTPPSAMMLSVVGDTFADIVCRPVEKLPSWGTDTLVTDPIRVMLGGSAANVAVHIANLRRGRVGFSGTESGDVGVEGATEAASAGRAGPVAKPIDGVGCHLHSSIASDTMGNILRNDLEELGVNWSQSREPRHQGTCVVLTGREDRSFVTHRGSVAEFCRDDIDVPRLLASSHVHVAGFYNCPALAEDLPGLLAEARAGGATCSLGPQWDASERWGGLDSLYPLLDVFISNENEARSISRCENIAQAASFFLDRGVGLVVVSRGADGAVALSRESGARTGEGLGESGTRSLTKWDQRSSKAEVVDTTGAGDAFSAGFLYVWKATGDVQAALRWGCALGSTLVTRVGASMRLSVEEDIRPRLVP